MHAEFASVIWDELKRYINVVDRNEAADALVNILIDNDCDSEDIRNAFGGDKEVKNALANYSNDDVEEEEEEEEDLDYEDDDDWA